MIANVCNMPSASTQAHRPCLQHVNMQIDTFIANAPADDLRSILRAMLATGPAEIQPAFTKVARTRAQHTYPKSFPSRSSLFAAADTTHPETTQALWDFIKRARTIFGIGLGFQSLPLLTHIISSTSGLRWELDSAMEDSLVTVDLDIAQAIQSCKEQFASDNLSMQVQEARSALNTLRDALVQSRTEVDAWGGEFPFERALMSIDGWKFL